jgi:predicted phage terminase large subunit-like protein
MTRWSVTYERAIRNDGSLLFPERLTKEFLDNARRTMGSYLFANQYQNEVIPDDEKSFKLHWLKYYKAIPENTYRFGFIDPAIGQDKHHDYTGISVIDVDTDGVWYLRLAQRVRLTPTEIVDKMFDLCREFQLKALGVEVVAYQEALLYILAEKMRERKITLPVKDIRRSSTSKQTRILGLVPRFEWGRLLIAQGMVDFEDEYNTFPRGKFDDILDSVASLEEIVFYPVKKEIEIVKPHSPHDTNYERWIIRDIVKRQQSSE